MPERYSAAGRQVRRNRIPGPHGDRLPERICDALTEGLASEIAAALNDAAQRGRSRRVARLFFACRAARKYLSEIRSAGFEPVIVKGQRVIPAEDDPQLITELDELLAKLDAALADPVEPRAGP